MKILNKKFYRIYCSNGDVYQIPVLVIAQSYAKYYHEVDQISFEESLDNTIESFNRDRYEIEDWARGNMDWGDVVDHAVKLDREPIEINMEDEWVNPKKIEYV